MNENAWVKRLDDFGRKSWLILNIEFADYDIVDRTKPYGLPLGAGKRIPAKRLKVSSDGCTQFDAIALPGGRYKVRGNGCKRLSYFEDLAFRDFRIGQVVTRTQIGRAFRRYVQLSVRRAQKSIHSLGNGKFGILNFRLDPCSLPKHPNLSLEWWDKA